MQYQKGKVKNYEYYDYKFEKTTVRYVVMNETQNVFMILIPNGMEEEINDTYETVKLTEDNYPDHRDWFSGSLVHLHLSHHINSTYDNSYKFGESTTNLKFFKQEMQEEKEFVAIKTYLKADEGYSVCHTLKHFNDENGFEVCNEFFNDSGKTVTLEMISSASLDNLSPFLKDDGSESLIFHHFKGGWATEGKHIKETLPELNLEKSCGGSFESEKIGSIGSKTVGRNFPYAAVEDIKSGCTWGMKLKHNATWQIELTRYGIDLSLSCGIGDYCFGAWKKDVANGESFKAPAAYVAVAMGGIAEVSNDLLQMDHRAVDALGEEGMPIMFNDWCTTRGNPSHERLVEIASKLKGNDIKYFIVDDGWQENGIGDWTVDEKRFPNGLKAFCDEIREIGMIPGIWMEFEAVRINSKTYDNAEDALFLQKDGVVVQGTVFNQNSTKFWDFRKKEVIEHLDEVVIKFLKDNGIGYIKVDYNSNIGIGCDGAESHGEGLRQQMDGVFAFFEKIRKEIPDLIIENCSSGGSRLEPKMMSITHLSSFSDAHECFESPVVAANLHYLIQPRQSQVFCVLHECFDEKHMQYVISNGFLGRLVWSGDIDELTGEQLQMMFEANKFYNQVSHIIKHGRSYIHRTDFINNRNPIGTQAVVRYSQNSNEILVVCHFFNNAKEMEIPLNGDYEISDSLYKSKSVVENGVLKIKGFDKSGNVLHLRKVR